MRKVNYYEYIKSEAWAAKRAEFFATGYVASRECLICKAPRRKGFHVHHLTYKRLGRERMKDLAIVCPDCHEAVHEFHKEWSATLKKKGKAFDLRKATFKIRTAVRSKTHPHEYPHLGRETKAKRLASQVAARHEI